MLFEEGFVEYQENGIFTDLTLVVGGKDYRVHKLVLVYSSEFFDSLLTSKFKEHSQEAIELKFEDEDNVFPSVLRFMYSGEIVLTETNCLAILAMADKYLIHSLREVCISYITQSIKPSNALAILDRAFKFGVQNIADQCIEVIAKNFTQYHDELDWRGLPLESLLCLLQHEYLAVRNEYEHYKKLCAYIDAADPPISDDRIQDLMETIRFRWLSYPQLKEVESNPMVPRNLIVEALMARLADKEGFKQNANAHSSPARLAPRIVFGRQFEYNPSKEFYGILHWISTNGNTELATNPHVAGRVVVTASSVERGEPHELVSRTPTELWTKDVPASWFSIDFGKHRQIRPTFYTLRHGGNYRGDSLRTWDLQGSMNGNDWTLLRRHTNDSALDGRWATHTWEVDTEHGYRIFRILQTGHNSASHNFLVVSGIEFYGDLYETSSKC
eukprot:TRINITY_DN4008_c0_g1_i1.p1 TRINITY_DN4008_c0_g1~~TRINITY_DN4008_c0_g1_i1.p1  ORF type:complete len:443 (-),score=85.19 TRINITY_DN4008_c0_g1_i1:188-1516(-)